MQAASRVALALSLYRHLSWCDRQRVSASAVRSPLRSLVARTPAGRVLDAGCGHGVLSALLAQDSPRRQVVGVDPDGPCIRAAQASVGALPNVSFRAGTLEQQLAGDEGSFDAVVVANVLFTLSDEAARRFLAAAFQLLKPGGRLLVAEVEADGGWRTLAWHVRERLAAALLLNPGGRVLVPREVQVQRLRAAGFRVEEVRSLASGASAPHALFNAQRPA